MILRCLTFLMLLLLTPPAYALPGPGLSATVTVWSDDGEDRFLGSAFALNDGDQVVTNDHVVGKAAHVQLETSDGQRLRARVVARDPLRDLALLEPETPLPGALRAAGTAPTAGEATYAVGAPMGTGLALTSGIISALNRQIDPQQPVRYLQHSAPVNPGSSGGPLLNAAGQVIGINTRIVDGSRYFVGIAYAIPVEDILAFLATPDRPRPVNPGLQVRKITPRIATALDLPNRDGVLVETVVPGGPADRAGLRAGDVLLRMGGTLVNRPGDIALILAAQIPDTLTVRRDGAERDLPLTLTATPRSLPTAPGAEVATRRDYSLPEMGLRIDPDGQVAETSEGSVGFYSGLSVDDRILAVNGKPLETLPARWQDETRFTGPVLLLLELSDGSTRHVLLDPWTKTVQLRPTSGANVMDQDVVAFE